jgi:mRNA-degrading endonuclease RelE of RelBE toxin-antitoxin system
MTSAFTVLISPHCERLAKGQQRKQPDFVQILSEAIDILGSDPYNQSRSHAIRKLTGPQSDGQWRLRIGRWRFRYDIVGQNVELKYCGLRREDTYR